MRPGLLAFATPSDRLAPGALDEAVALAQALLATHAKGVRVGEAAYRGTSLGEGDRAAGEEEQEREREREREQEQEQGRP